MDTNLTQITSTAMRMQLEIGRPLVQEIMRERNTEIRAINEQMANVNEIFKDLAHIVNNQQEDVDNIETMMEKSHEHAKAGLEQVKKANEYQKGCVLQ